MKKLVIGIAAAVLMILGIFVAFGGLALAAVVDNKVGWGTKRDEKLLRQSAINGVTVDEIVARQYARPRWGAYHEDELYRSVVECDAIDAAGRPVRMSWEVAHWYTPRSDVKRRRVFITALNREAAQLTPSFAAPDLPLKYYPQHVRYSEAVYGLASKKLSE